MPTEAFKKHHHHQAHAHSNSTKKKNLNPLPNKQNWIEEL